MVCFKIVGMRNVTTEAETTATEMEIMLKEPKEDETLDGKDKTATDNPGYQRDSGEIHTDLTNTPPVEVKSENGSEIIEIGNNNNDSQSSETPPGNRENTPSVEPTLKGIPSRDTIITYDICDCKSNAPGGVIFEDEEFVETRCSRCVDKTHGALVRFFKSKKKWFKYGLFGLVFILFDIFFIYVVATNFDQSVGLIAIFCTIVAIVGLKYALKFNKVRLSRWWTIVSRYWDKYWKYTKWLIYVALLTSLVVFIALDVARDVRRLTSLSGLLALVIVTFLFSTNPARVKWRPVVWGLILQLLFGLVVLRWPPGRRAVEWFAAQVVIFLEYADEGSKFVFGEDTYMDHPFAFQSLPVVVFFSSVISVLYHWGLMQGLVRVLAAAMQVTMATTALESLASVSNIFVSYVEVAPMTLPYLERLTKSEIHAILTSGFATAAGSILALYVNAGAPPEHLIPACIVSAPAAMAIAKLSYPETKVSLTRHQADIGLPKGKERNFIEAAANGSMVAISLVAGIVVCLISFIAIVAFLNGVLAWLGHMAGLTPFSFQDICSYVFWPLVVLMGVETADAQRVARQMGLKIFLDDILCYADLGEAIKNGEISRRSTVIATYACCGFGSIGAMGVAMGAMLSLSPGRRGAIALLVPRALVNGNIAAFMTACVAGLLYEEDTAFAGLEDVNATTSSWFNISTTASGFS